MSFTDPFPLQVARIMGQLQTEDVTVGRVLLPADALGREAHKQIVAEYKKNSPIPGLGGPAASNYPFNVPEHVHPKVMAFVTRRMSLKRYLRRVEQLALVTSPSVARIRVLHKERTRTQARAWSPLSLHESTYPESLSDLLDANNPLRAYGRANAGVEFGIEVTAKMDSTYVPELEFSLTAEGRRRGARPSLGLPGYVYGLGAMGVMRASESPQLLSIPLTQTLDVQDSRSNAVDATENLSSLMQTHLITLPF